MELIRCDCACFGYEGRAVVQDVTLAVEPGDYIGIIGENGAGKSTLIKGLLGLLKPMEGSVAYGSAVEQDGIGYLPQQTDLQKNFPATVGEVVLSGCLRRCGLRPFYTKKEKELADQNMKRMGIGDLKNRCYRELSGGQRQRALIARALCATDSILVLDEPVSGLDPMAVKELYQMLDELNQKEGLAILMVSHDLDHVLKHAREILLLDGGVRFYGTVSEYENSASGRMMTEGGNRT